jgi:5'-nucleotidase
MKKKTLYIDMDGVLVDFQSGINQLPGEIRNRHQKSLDNTPGIFGLMQPMPGAIEAYERLSEIFDTYILSTAPWENPSAWSDKLLWVKKYLGEAAHKRLILSHHKNLLKGHFIVDDRDKRGVTEFEGEHIFFGKEKFPDWGAVVEYLEKKLAKEEKLMNVPVEEDTFILFERMHEINGIDVLYQKWRWKDYLADSIIFLDEDVAGMTEEEIVKMVKKDATCRKGSKVTFSQNGNGYTFVNFNFEEDEPVFSVDMEKLRKQSQHVERWEKEIMERDEALKDNQKRQKPI